MNKSIVFNEPVLYLTTIFKSSNLLPSLTAKTWMVPWSLATQSKVESAEKLMQFTEAGWWGGGDGDDYLDVDDYLDFGDDDNRAQNFYSAVVV